MIMKKVVCFVASVKQNENVLIRRKFGKILE